VARRFLSFAVIAFMVAGCAAAAAVPSPSALDLALVATASPSSEATPSETPSPSPVPTAIPTPVPTAIPTAIPTAVPVVVYVAPVIPPAVATPPPAPVSNCHPSYVGACLTPGIGDYDCLGGSGNGPNYVGRVQVIGWDEYGLDADGNGIGCESS
jgi:hypothetical protein